MHNSCIRVPPEGVDHLIRTIKVKQQTILEHYGMALGVHQRYLQNKIQSSKWWHCFCLQEPDSYRKGFTPLERCFLNGYIGGYERPNDYHLDEFLEMCYTAKEKGFGVNLSQDMYDKIKDIY